MEKLKERDIEAELKMEDKEPLAPEVRELVHYLYSEASLALKERIAGKSLFLLLLFSFFILFSFFSYYGSGKITDKGIETPLGILSLSQIEQGEKILIQISKLLPKEPTYI